MALRARPEHEGKTKKCRACGQIVEVTRDINADVVLVQQPIPDESKLCPFCGEEIKKIAVKCKHCGESLNQSATPSPASKQPALFFSGRGRFNFTGSYEQAFELTRQAFRESGVKVSEASKQRATIAGSCSYGLNLFGISVSAAFYAAGPETCIEISASLSDAFDTMGVCDKKVEEISSRLDALVASLSSTGSVGHTGDAAAASLDFAAGEIVSSGAPPYRHREGPGHHGKALTGFVFCVLGLCFPPAAILGLILCGLASTGIATSRNKAGQMWASIGSIIGLCVIVIWCLMLLNHFR